MQSELLDDFRDASAWSAIASGRAELLLAQEETGPGHALRLDFDFKGSGGFVVARRAIARAMPEVWALAMRIRGAAPANKLEIKLVDPTNRNVWWWHRDAFELPADWQPLRIRSSEVAFAWGPAGGGPLRDLAAIEIAIAAGPGGSGTVWIEDLRLEDLSLREPPRARASSAAAGHSAEHVLHGSAANCWQSAPGAALPQWLSLDFGAEYEYGGLTIDWAPGGEPRAFEVQASDDGDSWRTLWSARQAEGPRHYVYLPGGGRSRHLRLWLREPAGPSGFAVAALRVEPFEFSRSLHDFFHAVAERERRGLHPRWLHRTQTYWTPVGVDGGTTTAILNEEGMLEPDRASFSLEPFLFADGELGTWADAEVSQSLAESCLPIPSSHWRWRDLALEATAFATDGAEACARIRYRVENRGAAPKRVRLFAALRPFQVTPPWQSFQGMGGTSPISDLAWDGGAVAVNGRKIVLPLDAPSGFGAAAFEQGEVTRHLVRGELPPNTDVHDDFAHASGALCWDLELGAGGAREVEIAVPFGERAPDADDCAALGRSARAISLEATARAWSEELGAVSIRLGGGAECLDALRTAAAHIVVNRDGPALHPGPRRYTRSWIRDGATMSAALLRMGFSTAVRDFIRWYAPYQDADGDVPCAVDRNGADWLPEHDSHGQLAFTVAEYWRMTGDSGLAAELWPNVLAATRYLEQLRGQRLGAEFRTGERRACYGLLPESASHEGYLAHPVHAYWDDFWALRGLGDAADLAQALGDEAEAKRLNAVRDALGECLYASIETTIADRNLRYIPGSVEWADFDPAATATALVTTDAARRLPEPALRYSYDEYLAGFRRRRDGEIDWNNYTAYEIRIVGALVRLGRREEAHELLDFFLSDRRPRVWNQWPEISWRDPRSPGHLGDVPHTWIGAEYVLAVLGMLAYESPDDGALVLAAGVSDAWLGGEGVAVEGLPTWWGPLGYRLRRDGASGLRLDLAPGLREPPGGIVVRPPLARPLARVAGDGVVRFDGASATLRGGPASVRLMF
ncbi:MAG TPA: discoidin domain-containing protein [Myxococcota bacterium]|nr:discoidin domain-containing protein [Myxococcota bacterium]